MPDVTPSHGISLLEEIPESSALERAHRVSERLSAVGFDWPDLAGVLDKLDEERRELNEALHTGDPREVEAEYGDLLLAAANVGRFLGLCPETSLRLANERFEARFRKLEVLAALRGVEIGSAGIEALEALWREVKAMERASP